MTEYLSLWRHAERPTAYRAAEAGQLPAEALTAHDRRLLVRQFVAAGMTDDEIAHRTLWTLYTAARIRESLRGSQHLARSCCGKWPANGPEMARNGPKWPTYGPHSSVKMRTESAPALPSDIHPNRKQLPHDLVQD